MAAGKTRTSIPVVDTSECSQLPIADLEATSNEPDYKVSSKLQQNNSNESNDTSSDSNAQTRQRIDSLSIQSEPVRRSSFLGDTESSEFNRAGSISCARPPSIIEVEESGIETPSNLTVASNDVPARSPKRRQKATVTAARVQDRDTHSNGTTDVHILSTVTKNQNKNVLNVESSDTEVLDETAKDDHECLRLDCKTASTDSEHNPIPKQCPQHDSSSGSGSPCHLGGSLSSYEAQFEFPQPQAEV